MQSLKVKGGDDFRNLSKFLLTLPNYTMKHSYDGTFDAYLAKTKKTVLKEGIKQNSLLQKEDIKRKEKEKNK